MDNINKMFNRLIIIFLILLIISVLWSCSIMSGSTYLSKKYHKISPIITFSISWMIIITTNLKRKYQMKEYKYLKILLPSLIIWILGILSILNW